VQFLGWAEGRCQRRTQERRFAVVGCLHWPHPSHCNVQPRPLQDGGVCVQPSDPASYSVAVVKDGDKKGSKANVAKVGFVNTLNSNPPIAPLCPPKEAWLSTTSRNSPPPPPSASAPSSASRHSPPPLQFTAGLSISLLNKCCPSVAPDVGCHVTRKCASAACFAYTFEAFGSLKLINFLAPIVPCRSFTHSTFWSRHARR
jgi:hypothetical protein